MIIKKINIQDNYIEISEEKKRLFGVKNRFVKVDISTIDKIERLVEKDKLIGFVLWNGKIVEYSIGIRNYKENLVDLYNRIVSCLSNEKIKITSTKL